MTQKWAFEMLAFFISIVMPVNVIGNHVRPIRDNALVRIKNYIIQCQEWTVPQLSIMIIYNGTWPILIQ